MAARQDQTLQIALIVSAMMLVVFIGLTYYAFKLNGDSQQEVATLQSEKEEERTRANNLQAENETQRGYIGIDQFATADVVEEQFKKDMAKMASTLPKSRRKYRDALTQAYQEKEALIAAQAVDKATVKTLELKLKEIEAGHQAQISQFNKQIVKIEQQAAADRNQFVQARLKLDANKKALADRLEKQTNQFDTERRELNTEVSSLTGEVQKRQKTIDKLLDERTVDEFSFEIADGQIKWVNQANSTAWINLGSADALRRQVTFSVYDTEETDAGKAEKKGSIEVIRMLGNHMAECRVTSDDPHNPILPGDYIYNQVWQAGRPQHFALTGFVDLDGDGRSDLQMAKDLIAMNGGIVDSFPDKEGKVSGKMTINTRYLVLGEYPKAAGRDSLRDAWATMSSEANSLGVEKINLTDFMNQMGYKPENRTVKLGRGVNTDDFRPRPNPASGDLRPRSPYDLP